MHITSHLLHLDLIQIEEIAISLYFVTVIYEYSYLMIIVASLLKIIPFFTFKEEISITLILILGFGM